MHSTVRVATCVCVSQAWGEVYVKYEYFDALMTQLIMLEVCSGYQVNIPHSAKCWRGNTLAILSIDSPKFSYPSIFNKLTCNGKPTQFTKVLLPNRRVE